MRSHALCDGGMILLNTLARTLELRVRNDEDAGYSLYSQTGISTLNSFLPIPIFDSFLGLVIRDTTPTKQCKMGLWLDAERCGLQIEIEGEAETHAARLARMEVCCDFDIPIQHPAHR